VVAPEVFAVNADHKAGTIARDPVVRAVLGLEPPHAGAELDPVLRRAVELDRVDPRSDAAPAFRAGLVAIAPLPCGGVGPGQPDLGCAAPVSKERIRVLQLQRGARDGLDRTHRTPFVAVGVGGIDERRARVALRLPDARRPAAAHANLLFEGGIRRDRPGMRDRDARHQLLALGRRVIVRDLPVAFEGAGAIRIRGFLRADRHRKQEPGERRRETGNAGWA